MKIYRYESIIILVVLFITILVNLSAFLYRSLVTPPGRVFVGTQFYSDDYGVYVSYLKQGQQGNWRTVDKYTSELHEPSLIHEEYLLIGKLAGLFRVSPVLSYHFSRLVLGVIFLVSIYSFFLSVLPRRSESVLRVTGFILATLGNGFLKKTDEGWSVFLSWLTDLDPTQRFGAVPHYQLGFIGLVVIFICFYSLISQTRKGAVKKHFLILAIFAFITGFVLPSSLIVALSTLAIFACLILIRFIFEKKKNLLTILKFSFLTICILLITNLLNFIYYQKILRIPPWSHILAWEMANKAPVTLKEFLLALGPVGFLFPLGLLAFRRRKKLVIFLFSWITAAFLWAFGLADLLGFNSTRFFQSPVYLPMAILTVLAIRQIIGKSRKLVLIAGVSGIILIGLPTSFVSLKTQLQMYADFSGLTYPEKDLVEAYGFLEDETKPEEVVLSLYQSGNLIPFLAGNTVYLGHLQETVDYWGKVKQAEIFYSGQLADSQAKEFLKNNHLELVFFSYHEKSLGGKIEGYSFLKPIFRNEQVTIFRLIND